MSDPRDDGTGRLCIKHDDCVEYHVTRWDGEQAITEVRRAWVTACDGRSVTVNTPEGPLTLELRRVKKVNA